MRMILTRIGLLIAITTATVCLGQRVVYAEESTSFRLYADFPNYTDLNAKQSTNFSINEDGTTWNAYPSESANFKIVTAPPVASSSSSSSPSSSSSAGGGGGGGGGRRHCGNAFLEAGEQCDDGNVSDGDGCSKICEVEHFAPPPPSSSSSSSLPPSSVPWIPGSSAGSSAPIEIPRRDYPVSRVRPVPDVIDTQCAVCPATQLAQKLEHGATHGSAHCFIILLLLLCIGAALSLHVRTSDVTRKKRWYAAVAIATGILVMLWLLYCLGASGGIQIAGLMRTDAVEQPIGELRFFTAEQPLCEECLSCLVVGTEANGGSTDDHALAVILLLLLLVLIASLPFHGECEEKKKKGTHRITRFGTMRMLSVLLSIGALAASMAAGVPEALANTGPQTHVYNGHLLNSAGVPITTSHTIRFSYWKSEDYIASDTTGTGAVNTAAATYGGWNETHTVTPNADGYFSVNLGSVTALPDLGAKTPAELTSLFLQVEVKSAASPNTSYELLDRSPSSASSDRSPVLAVPFALNSDMLDQHHIGTGSGAIPVLQSGGLLPISTIPGGTNSNTFILDNDNNAGSTITLQFGQTLGKTLTYNIPQGLFIFNNSVKIEGNLTVTGKINNIPAASYTPLYVATGSALNVTVNSGAYRLNGNIANFPGSGSVTVRNNATNYVFFTSTGLTMNVSGFPTDKSFIPLAKVTASGGVVRELLDRRVLQNDDREQTVEEMYNPEFADAAYKADGSSNVGKLFVNHDTSSGSLRNFYQWTSSKSSLQDYDIDVRVSLPSDFVRWKDNFLSVAYRSTATGSTNNRLDFAVYDTSGNAVTLSGSSVALTSLTWATTQLDFTGSPTWTAGQDFLIRLKVSARNNFEIHLGRIGLKYVVLKRQ